MKLRQDTVACIDYVSRLPAGSSELTFQDGLKMDCDEHGALLEKRKVNGKAMKLSDFVTRAREIHDELREEHVLALRL